MHVYLCLNAKKDVRRPDYFDVLGHHGNYQGCKCSAAVVKYCKKEGDYLEHNMDVK